MTLSSKDRYAIIAMLELAVKRGERPVPLIELSQQHNISVSYLEQLFAKLRQAGLVKSRRGPTGGYMLGREATDISINDIVRAIRHGDATISTFPRGSRTNDGLKLWNNLSNRIRELLDDISLEDVLRSEQTGHLIDYTRIQGKPTAKAS